MFELNACTDEEPVAINGGETATDGTESSSGEGGMQSDSSNSGGGVSRTTLAVAVAVPIVILLVAFAIVIVLGIRRGWFVRRGDRHTQNAQQQEKRSGGEGAASSPDRQEHGKNSHVQIGEMHSNDRPYQVEGNGIYQLYGSEERR